MKSFGFVPTDILLPKAENMTAWSCVACDQYTSEPEYWQAVEGAVGAQPSTLRLMLPEIYLSETEKRSEEILQAMHEYLENGAFKTVKDSFIYVERTLANGKIRYGLVGAMDLEAYDFSEGTRSLCRPTEATVTSRLPARVEIRAKAPLEMPHIMILADDPQKKLIEQFAAETDRLECVYDFDLMQKSGHIRGYKISGADAQLVQNELERLYNSYTDEFPMLYAMGDGNHSLAAAKLYYERLKDELGDKALSHPARYALAELVNLRDDSLEFEPIHRVLFDVDTENFMTEFKDFGGLKEGVHDGQVFSVIINGKQTEYTFTSPVCAVTVGGIQGFIDSYISKHGGETDYIHGDEVVKKLASAPNRIGFTVKGISKDSFFDVIKKDGILPRKTFSMGHAADKRFYLECRRLCD